MKSKFALIPQPFSLRLFLTVESIIHALNSIILEGIVSLYMNFKESMKKYAPYFVDVWQYVVIIVIFIIAAIFFL